MRCQKADGTYTTVTWKYFYPKCSKISQSLGLCSAVNGAYVPAIIVCYQKLY